MTRPTWIVALVLGLLAVVSLHRPAALSAQQPSPPCQAPEHRQFDFWVGTWTVTTPNGQVAGTNTIERAMNGCVLHESYTATSGYHGESFNIYDAARGVWHQSWVDSSGLLLSLEGGFEDGEMVLQGETVGPDGAVSQQRITWSVVDGDPNRVRQLWESRKADGDWTVAFDGLYTRTEG
jgi:hypothetical protein